MDTKPDASAAGRGAPQPRPPELEEAIRRRATELWEQRGRVEGHGLEDWVRAETEVTREWDERKTRRTASMVIRLKDVMYTVEYDPDNAAGYQPGEFATGAPVELRLTGEKIFVKRHNGQEFETRIVKKEKRHAMRG